MDVDVEKYWLGIFSLFVLHDVVIFIIIVAGVHEAKRGVNGAGWLVGDWRTLPLVLKNVSGDASWPIDIFAYRNSGLEVLAKHWRVLHQENEMTTPNAASAFEKHIRRRRFLR